MPTSRDTKNAAEKLLEADASLERVLQACKQLEQASHQLDAAKSNVHALANGIKDLVTAVRQVSTDALEAVRAVKAIDPGQIYARLDKAEAAAHAVRRSVVRAVWICGVTVTVVLGFLVLLRT